MTSELPQKSNKRGGPGWWMDGDGAWRSPADWPGDYPPIENWTRGSNGQWQPPTKTSVEVDQVVFGPSKNHRGTRSFSGSRGSTKGRPVAERSGRNSTLPSENLLPQTPKEETHSAKPEAESDEGDDMRSNVRAMLLAGGALGVCAVLLIAAFVMQSRAEALEEVVVVTEAPEVVFAAETEAVRQQRRDDAARQAPEASRVSLAGLRVVEPPGENTTRSTADIFDETLWVAPAGDCLDPSETALVERTSTPIVWADNFECVPAEGLWFDNYLGMEIRRTIDAEVRYLVPPQVVLRSGGSEWTPSTRANYLTDVAHPATLVVLALDSGHNPRHEAPDVWRPSNRATWCGYAVDWIAVKARWELSVTEAERSALEEMLDSCTEPDSIGAHSASMVIDSIEPADITLVNDG